MERDTAQLSGPRDLGRALHLPLLARTGGSFPSCSHLIEDQKLDRRQRHEFAAHKVGEPPAGNFQERSRRGLGRAARKGRRAAPGSPPESRRPPREPRAAGARLRLERAPRDALVPAAAERPAAHTGVAPPYAHAHQCRAPDGGGGASKVSLAHSRSICRASSRVGASTRADGRAGVPRARNRPSAALDSRKPPRPCGPPCALLRASAPPPAWPPSACSASAASTSGSYAELTRVDPRPSKLVRVWTALAPAPRQRRVR